MNEGLIRIAVICCREEFAQFARVVSKTHSAAICLPFDGILQTGGTVYVQVDTAQRAMGQEFDGYIYGPGVFRFHAEVLMDIETTIRTRMGRRDWE